MADISIIYLVEFVLRMNFLDLYINSLEKGERKKEKKWKGKGEKNSNMNYDKRCVLIAE